MKFKTGVNYVVLANEITNEFMNNFSNIAVIDGDLTIDEIKKKLEFFPSKQVVFRESWYNLRNKEILEIINLLKLQNINFINVTSNIEEAIYADYIMVYDKSDLVSEGDMKMVLKEEKMLKKLGYGLPFVVDLSIQLNYYDIFDNVYYEMDTLVGDLWN